MSEFTNEGFNAGYRAGIIGERERIIEFLEHSLEHEYSEPDWMGFRAHLDWCKDCGLIAEIKGEN